MEVTSPVSTAASSPVATPAEPRQRWRVRYRRRADAPALPQREQLAAWEAGLAVSGLPLVGLELATPRPRLVFAAPLGVGVPAEAELVDLLLSDRRTVADVRVRLRGSLPAGHELLDVHDVWLGEPPLSGRVLAADYRVELGTESERPNPEALAEACRRLLGAEALLRTRDKAGRSVAYDLRPLLADAEVVPGAADGPVVVRVRVRFDPERGVGRPEEVLAALSELAGAPLVAGEIVRERLILAGEDPTEPVAAANAPAAPTTQPGT